MSSEELQGLSESEYGVLSEFMKAGTGVPELLRRYLASKIAELDSLQDIEPNDVHALEHVYGKKEAHDKLVEIFNGLDLGALGDLIQKRGTKGKSFR
ncbi:MAG: hypothetical protein WC477_07575 [Patescibacteria group bacterium]